PDQLFLHLGLDPIDIVLSLGESAEQVDVPEFVFGQVGRIQSPADQQIFAPEPGGFQIDPGLLEFFFELLRSQPGQDVSFLYTFPFGHFYLYDVAAGVPHQLHFSIGPEMAIGLDGSVEITLSGFRNGDFHDGVFNRHRLNVDVGCFSTFLRSRLTAQDESAYDREYGGFDTHFISFIDSLDSFKKILFEYFTQVIKY